MSLHSEELKADGPLRFTDEKQLAQFELGVACAVFLWDDLAIAVANGWGGPESAEKREWLAGIVTDLFEESEVSTADIEYRLLAGMLDEFDVVVETESAYLVAQRIVEVYKQCRDNNYTLAQELFEKFQKTTPLTAGGLKYEQETSSDDSSAEESGDDAPMLVDDGMDVDDEPKQPEVDEDGFTVVRRGRK